MIVPRALHQELRLLPESRQEGLMDNLDPARGVFTAFAIGSCIWALVFLVWWLA